MRLMLCNAAPGQAQSLARAVVEEGLVACVNLVPIRSVYRWEGKVHDDPEVTLWIKVAAEKVDATRARILALHDYDLPEILVLPIDAEASHGPYVEWVRSTG